MATRDARDSRLIHDGAMTYLKRQYLILVGFIIVVVVLLAVFIDKYTAVSLHRRARIFHARRVFRHEGRDKGERKDCSGRESLQA